MKGWKSYAVAAGVVMALVLAGGCSQEHHGMNSEHAKKMQAIEAATDGLAVITPTEGNKVHGWVRFQKSGPDDLKVIIHLEGLTAGSIHACHIHEWGDVSDMKEAMSTGGHFDPAGTHHHASLDAADPHHAGDMGNLTANAEGVVDRTFILDGVSVCGHLNPVVGRAVIVHAKPDDFGQPTGNAGGRIGVGVIGLTKHM